MPSETESSYVLNEKNRLITIKYIEGTLEKFGVQAKIKNLPLFQQAMTHLSYLVRDENFYENNKTKPYQLQSTEIDPLDDTSKAIPLQRDSYERLEFLGDAILHAILAEYLFQRYNNMDEGFMTKLRTKIENGDTLSILSKTIGLTEYVLISRYVEKNGGRDSNKSLSEDVFEAFIGALYLEIGFDLCRKFVVAVIEKEIDLAQMLYQETNFKEKLLQHFHMRRWLDPIYGTLDISGPENKKMYTMWVKRRKHQHDEGEIIGIGISTNKKNGEQLAAKQGLIQLGQYTEGGDSDAEIIEEYESDTSAEEYESDISE